MNWIPLLLIAAGGAVALFGRQLLEHLVEDFENGIGFTVTKVRVKFTGNTITIPVVNVKISRTLSIIIDLLIRNANPVGGKVNSFTGSLSYGKGGALIAPITAGGFMLPAKGEVTTSWNVNIDLLSSPGTVVSIVDRLRKGDLRKLWLSGVLSTTFGPVPIDREIGIQTA